MKTSRKYRTADLARQTTFVSFFREHSWALLILCFAGFLVFNYLDNQVLWQDEAETAMLAKSVLRYGYPNGYYGDYVISPVNLRYKEYGMGGAWLYATWLPYYLTALSFLLFGISTWAARFPFALGGFLSFVVTYVLARKLFREKTVALLSLAIMSVSVPTLLLFRQCRYYSLQTLFTLLVVFLYLELVLGFSRRKLLALLLSLFSLFHTTQGMFIPVVAWMIFDFLVFGRWRYWVQTSWKWLWMGGSLLVITTVPWYFFLVTYQNTTPLEWVGLWRNLQFVVRMTNKFIFPLAANAVLLCIIWRSKNREEISSSAQQWIQVVVPFILINSVFFVFLRHRMMRYHVHLFPLYFMVQAWILYHLAKKSRFFVSIAVFVLICLTNVVSSSGAKFFSSLDVQKNVAEFKNSFRSYLPDYLYEITHLYEGPTSNIVNYLRQNAVAGQTVKVPMNAESDSLQFYLSELCVLNGFFFVELNFPDWIVPRDYWVREELRLAQPEDLPDYEAYLNEIGRKYERIELDTYDIVWENRPDDLGYHKFKTVMEGLYKTAIYRKKSEDEISSAIGSPLSPPVEGRGHLRQPLIPIFPSHSDVNETEIYFLEQRNE